MQSWDRTTCYRRCCSFYISSVTRSCRSAVSLWSRIRVVKMAAPIHRKVLSLSGALFVDSAFNPSARITAPPRIPHQNLTMSIRCRRYAGPPDGGSLCRSAAASLHHFPVHTSRSPHITGATSSQLVCSLHFFPVTFLSDHALSCVYSRLRVRVRLINRRFSLFRVAPPCCFFLPSS